MVNDPDSLVAYPSPLNHCHHSDPVGALRLDHQEAFCLTEKHARCPVFLRSAPAPLPKEIRAIEALPKKRKARGGFLSAIFAALLILLAFGWALLRPKPSASPVGATLPPPTRTASPSPTPLYLHLFEKPSETPPPPVSVTPTPTLHRPLFGSVTPTQSPTFTPSVTPSPFLTKHRLDVPIGTERKFVIRRVSFKENLDKYIQQYSSSFKAVSAVNYYLRLNNSVARADMLVVFPVGFTDVSGMHVLTVYQIAEEDRGISYETLAAKLKTDLALFKYYNGISEAGERPLVGEYYLVPRQVIP